MEAAGIEQFKQRAVFNNYLLSLVMILPPNLPQHEKTNANSPCRFSVRKLDSLQPLGDKVNYPTNSHCHNPGVPGFQTQGVMFDFARYFLPLNV